MVNLILEELESLEDLSPNPKTNSVFTKLYNYCVIWDNYWLKITDDVLKINQICAEAEYKMEIYYTNKIINSIDPNKELNNFIYYKNYQDLAKLEYLNLDFFNNNIKNILFVWSWPLPLTAIVLAQKYNLKITLLDISKEAIELSKKLVESLEIEKNFEFITGDITKFTSDNHYDVIFLASLVCQSTDNEIIFSHINKSLKYTNILVRTSSWIRQLLYKKVDIEIFKKYFKVLLKVSPKNEIINSFIIAKKYE